MHTLTSRLTHKKSKSNQAEESSLSKEPSRFRYMQDEEIANLAKNGSKEATECLLHRYKHTVEQKSRAYYLLGADHDDVIQEGMIGLCKAIRDFREDRLSKFRPFAELCITRQIITAIKTATRQKHTPLNASISLHQTIGEECSENALIDIIPDKSIDMIEEYLQPGHTSKDILDMVNSVLSDLEKSVLVAYLSGKTYQEISIELNCPIKSIDNALQRSKRKMSSFFQNKRQSHYAVCMPILKKVQE